MNTNLELYTYPTYFIDSNHPDIIEKAQALVEGIEDEVEKIKKLFYFSRDSYQYSPYNVSFEHSLLKASYVLNKAEKKAYCTEKAVLFAALCRVVDIPNRLVFCNVRNHIATEKLVEILKTNLLVFHGYNEVWINNKWVKCTVAFNQQLCDKLGVDSLDFDGENDYIFQEFDKENSQFMVYEHDYGSFHDVPHDLWVSETKKYYPHFFANNEDQKEYLKLKD